MRASLPDGSGRTLFEEKGLNQLILFSVGIPSRLSEWCDAVLARIAGKLDAEVLVTATPSLDTMLEFDDSGTALDQAARSLICSGASHAVVGAREPDEKLYAALEESGAPFLLAFDDPRIGVADLFEATGARLNALTAVIANCCPLLSRFAGLPGALVIRRHSDPAPLVRSIAEHFGLPVTDAEAKSVVSEIGGVGFSPEANGIEARWTDRVPEAARKMIDGALGAYVDCVGDKLGQLVWTRELFWSAENAGDSLAEPVNLAGKPRHVVFGPFIRLPSGSWNVRLHLGVSSEAAGSDLVIDAYANGQLALTTLRPGRGGIYTVELNFSLMNRVRDLLELRVLVPTSTTKGELAFGQAVLTHVATPSGKDPLEEGEEEDFRAVLTS